MKIVLQTLGLIFVAFILAHWLSAGADDIVKGPSKPLDGTHQQQ